MTSAIDVNLTGRATAPTIGTASTRADAASSTTDARSVMMTDARPKCYPWILHPVIDLLLCCGGLLWLLFAVDAISTARGSQIFGASGVLTPVIILLGTIALADTHTAATLVRLYERSETRSKLQFASFIAPFICAASMIATLVQPDLLGVAARLYLILIVQHVTAQVYGITLLYCFKRSYGLNNLEKRALSLVLQTTMVYGIVRQFTPAWSSEKFIGVSLPHWVLPEWTVTVSLAGMAVAISFFAGIVIKKAFVEKKMMPLPALALLATGVGIFAVDRHAAGALWLYVPAFFHGSQYVVVTTAYYLKEHGLPENISAHQIVLALATLRSLKYWIALLTLGATIYFAAPAILGLFGVSWITAFAAIFCAINLHHFIADHALWKMRDPKVRTLLVA